MTLDHHIRLAYINTLLDGGYTRLADGTENPPEGYIVGGVTKESKMVETFVLIDDHYAEFKGLWRTYDMQLDECTALMGIGTWVHDGAIYFDVVELFELVGDALIAGFRRGEKAIYDCKNQKDMTL